MTQDLVGNVITEYDDQLIVRNGQEPIVTYSDLTMLLTCSDHPNVVTKFANTEEILYFHYTAS